MYLLVFTSRVKAHLMLFNKSKFCDKVRTTRSLVYKGMVYKGFFGPVLDFQKKLGFRVLDLGDLRVLENMSVLRPKPTHSIFLYI